jgi:hypothetical protein
MTISDIVTFVQVTGHNTRAITNKSSYNGSEDGSVLGGIVENLSLVNV